MLYRAELFSKQFELVLMSGLGLLLLSLWYCYAEIKRRTGQAQCLLFHTKCVTFPNLGRTSAFQLRDKASKKV